MKISVSSNFCGRPGSSHLHFPITPVRKSPRRALSGLGIVIVFLLVFGMAYLPSVVWPGKALAAGTYTVTLATDTSAPLGTSGDLRYAMIQANADPGSDIVFNIPGSGTHEIFIDSSYDLPPITAAGTHIHGYTQGIAADGPISSRTILIQINGNAKRDTGISIGANNCIVEGLSILGFKNSCVGVGAGTGNIVRSNYLGTTTNGSTVSGTKPSDGINISASGVDANNVIGGGGTDDGNLIAGYENEGITIRSNGNHVEGNYIGTDKDGTANKGGGDSGVWLDGTGAYVSQDNTIGGATARQGNLMCWNGSAGVTIGGAGAVDNLVVGNIIGSNLEGTVKQPNAYGVIINSAATSNTIGGDTAAESNVLSGNSDSGIQVTDTGTNDNVITGNHVGTNASEAAGIGNSNAGINLADCTGTVVGGSEAERNYIRYNGHYGIFSRGSTFTASYNTINDNGSGEPPYEASSAPLNNGGKNYENAIFGYQGCLYIGDPSAGEFAIVPKGYDGVVIPFADGTQDFSVGLIDARKGTGHEYMTWYTYLDETDFNKWTDMLLTMVFKYDEVTHDLWQPGVFQQQGHGNDYARNFGALTVVPTYYTDPPYLDYGSAIVDAGVALDGSSNCVITHNVIDENNGNGVSFAKMSGSESNEVSLNQIWNNQATGVVVWYKDSYKDKLSQNSIYGNGLLGISLGGSGVPTPNDGDNNNHNKPNRGYNYPEFTGSFLPWDGTGNATISGTAPPGATVELYKAGATPDPSGHGQGYEYLTFTTAAEVTGAFSADLTGLLLGDQISAIAISPAGDPSGEGNTSEFSENIEVEYPPPTVTSITPSSGNNDGTVNITNLAGTNFRSGAVVKLSKSGQADITGTNVKVASSTKIACAFNINGKATGSWKLTVTNTDAKSATRTGAFTVTSGTPEVDSVKPPTGEPGTEVTIQGAGFGSSRGESVVEFNGVAATEYTLWSDTKIVAVVPEGATSGSVRVVTTSGSSSEDEEFTVYYSTWYLAEGSTAWGFSTYITIENPNDEEVTAGITYMTGDGPTKRPDIKLPPLSQTVINPRDDIGSTDFSTKVECEKGKTVAVDRRMIWTGVGAASPEGHSSIGVTGPAKTWYLAEGSSAWGFETWLLIQNPNTAEATCQVTYMIEGEGPQTFEKKVPANSRATFNMENDVREKDASIKVSSDIPVIPERAMYRPREIRREGHGSIGMTFPSRDVYLAEGTTDYGFTTYVLIQNPNDERTEVTVTYMTPSGPREQASITIEPNMRKTIRVNDVEGVEKTDLSTHVHGSNPIIAERAMYWDNGTGEACHDSIGMANPCTTFYLPDGETSNGHETFTLMQNPNGGDVKVEISYLTPTGEGEVVFTDTIPANSRKTYNMADKGVSGRAAVMVRSLTSGRKIVCERAMYWNSRGAGTDTIGGYSN